MKSTLLYATALLALMALAGCSNSGGGDKATEVIAKPDQQKAPPATPPPGVNVPAAQNNNAFADAMQKQAKQGLPK